MALSRSLHRGALRLCGGFLAFQVARAALAFLRLIGLLAHMRLYFVKAIRLFRHYEDLQDAIQLLFGPAGGFLAILWLQVHRGKQA